MAESLQARSAGLYREPVEKAERMAASLADWRKHGGSLAARLARAVSNALLDGRLPLGVRLPSERALAAALGISRATVSEAYALLRDDDWLTTVGRSGSVAQLPPDLTRRIAPWPSEAGSPEDDVIDLVVASPSAPLPLYVEATSAAAAGLYRHAGTTGKGVMEELRAGIADRYTAQGMLTRPEEVLITGGAMPALALFCNVMLRSGARVIVEKPTYYEALGILRSARLRIAGWPVSAGWDPFVFRDLVASLEPAAAYVVPDFHNPTGALVDDEVRRAMVHIAERQRMWLIVDETMIDFDLRRPAAPPSRAEGPAAVRLGSLSKLVWSGLRIGWLRADGNVIRRLEQAPLAGLLAPPILEQLIALRLLEHLEDLARDRRRQLAAQRDVLLRELDGWSAAGLARVPDGGLTAWLELAPGMSSVELVRRATAHGLRLTPGGRFAADGDLDRFIRLPFTQPEATLSRAVRRLRELVPDG